MVTSHGTITMRPTFVGLADDEGRRVYRVGHELELPSVTEIVRATANTYGLDRWRAELGEGAEKVRDFAAARGRLLEAQIEAYLFGPDRGRRPDDAGVWWESVERAIDQTACTFVGL